MDNHRLTADGTGHSNDGSVPERFPGSPRDEGGIERAMLQDETRSYKLVRMSLEVELNPGEVSKYRRHVNGKGLVSPGARVYPSAFVSSAAYVESGAQVGPGSWIGQGSWIDHRAIIGAGVFIGANVHVGPDAVVGNQARLGSYTQVGRGAFIADGAIVDHEIQVPDFTDVGAAPAAGARGVSPVNPQGSPSPDRAGWRRTWRARRRSSLALPSPSVVETVEASSCCSCLERH